MEGSHKEQKKKQHLTLIVVCVAENCGKCSLDKFKLKRHTLGVHLVGSAAFGWDPEYTRNFQRGRNWKGRRRL